MLKSDRVFESYATLDISNEIVAYILKYKGLWISSQVRFDYF